MFDACRPSLEMKQYIWNPKGTFGRHPSDWPTSTPNLIQIPQLWELRGTKLPPEIRAAKICQICEPEQRPRTQSRLYQRLGSELKWTLNILPIPPRFYRRMKKSEIWSRFSTRVNFKVLWYRNEATCYEICNGGRWRTHLLPNSMKVAAQLWETGRTKLPPIVTKLFLDS